MLSAAFALGLLGLASASPVAPRDTPTSKGFQLLLKLTDPTSDFTPSIQNQYVASIHVGAGLSLVGISGTSSTGRIFYQNGTAEEYENNEATTVTDGGTPPFPQGLKLATVQGDAPGIKTANLNVGYGTHGVQLSTKGYMTQLVPETYIACNESLAYYQGAYFITIKQSESDDSIPENCRSVRLLPMCAELNDLPPDALSSHEFALDSKCYEMGSSKLRL